MEYLSLSENPPSEIISSSTNSLPASRSVYWRSELNYGFTMNPFYKESQKLFAFEEISPSKNGIIRCIRCRSYISPFCSINKLQRAWVCAICYESNKFSPSYNFEIDELPKTSYYDIYAPVEYIYKPLQLPSIIFLIDLSNPHIFNSEAFNLLKILNSSLSKAFSNKETNKEILNPKIGFVTFTSQSVQLYKVEDETVSIVVLSQINKSPHLLHKHNIFYELYSEESLQITESITYAIKEHRNKLALIKSNKENSKKVDLGDSCTEYAANLCVDILKDTGGKLILFQSSLPSTSSIKTENSTSSLLSILSIKSRNNKNNKNSNSNLENSKATENLDERFKLIGNKALNAEVGIDVHLMPFDESLNSSPISLSPFIELTKNSGSILFYKKLATQNCSQLIFEASQNLSSLFNKTTNFQSMMKIRMQDFFCLKAIHGNVHYNNDFINFPVVDEKTSLSTEIMFIKNDEKFSEKSSQCAERLERTKTITENIGLLKNYFFFQVSILHTTSEPSRKIRVINLALPKIENAQGIYNKIQCAPYMSLIAKRAAALSQINGLKSARDYLNESCRKFYRNYKQLSSNFTKISDMEDTNNILKELPKYTCGLLKCPIFSKGDVEEIQRNLMLKNIKSFNDNEIKLLGNPLLVDLKTKMQKALRLEELNDGTVYAVKTFDSLILRIGRNSGELVEEIFGVKYGVLSGMDEGEIMEKLRNIKCEEDDVEGDINEHIEYLREMFDDGENKSKQIIVVFEGSERDKMFREFLYEDRSEGSLGLEDLVGYLNNIS